MTRTPYLSILIAGTALIASGAAPTFVATINLGPQPPFGSAQQIAIVSATSRVYVLNSSNAPVPPITPSIAVVNTATATLAGTLQPPLAAGMTLAAATDTRNSVKGYAVNTSTNMVYVAYSGATSGTLVAIDSTRDAIVATTVLAGGIANVAVNPSSNKVYAISAGQILVLDGTTLSRVTSIPGVENGPLVVSPGNNKIYAALPAPSLGVGVIDGTRDVLTATVNLPVDTYDLILNPVTNNVYAKPNATANSPDFTVYEIDGSLDRLGATVSTTVANLSFGAAFNFSDSVHNRVYSSPYAIDGSSNTASLGLPAFEYPFGSSAPFTCQFFQGLAVDFSIGNMYGGCNGDMIVADSTTGTIRALVPVDYVINWVLVAVDPATHAVYGLNSTSLAIIDPIGLTSKLVQLGNVAGGAAANPVTNQVYLTDESSSAAVTVGGATNAITTKTFAQIGGMINAAFQASVPEAIAVDKTRNHYIVAGGNGGMVFDGATNAPLVPIRPQLFGPNGQVPLGFTFMSVNETTNKMYSTDNVRIFVTDLAAGTINVLVTPGLKPGDICTVRGLAINAAQNRVYASGVCQIASPVLFVYDGTTGVLIQSVDLGASIPTGSNAGDVLFNPKTNKLYITNYGGFSPVTATAINPATEVYNASTFAHLASIPNVIGPMAVDTVLNAIYALSNSTPASGDGNTGAVIDGNTDTLSSAFPLGFAISSIQPVPIAVNEATGMVYYVNSATGSVSVFQGTLPSPGTFSISGQLSGPGAAGVTITAQGGVTATAVTSATGAYTIAGLTPGAYTVTPTTAGLFYAPASQSVNITLANITGINFTALTSPVAVTGLALSPWTTIGPGVTTTGTVTIDQQAPAGGIVINLTAANSKVAKIPATVTVPAGSNSASFTVQSSSQSAVVTTTITATYQGSLALQPSSASVSITISPSDTLHIQSATYSKSTQLLKVTATSTNSQAILQLFLASNNQLLGTFTNLGGGNYSIQVTFIGTPASVNVKSNLGGSTGQGVTQLP